MASSSIVLNRILKSEEADLKDMFSKIIEEQMKKTTEELKKVAESKISEDLAKFYSGSFDAEKELFTEVIDQYVMQDYRVIICDKRKISPEPKELLGKKCFKIKTYSSHQSRVFYFTKNEVLEHKPHQYGGVTIYFKHNLPLNVLAGIKWFGPAAEGSSIGTPINPQFFLNHCAEFETICKQEEEERKAMMETLKQEREELESEKEQFYSIMTDYNAFQEEKKKFAEEKRKLSLVKLALEREKDKLKKEREEFEKEKRELEFLKSDEIDLDAYFERD